MSRPLPSTVLAAAVAFGLGGLTGTGSALAADFAPITDAERALTSVPSDPGAPAVVLYEKARLKLLDYPHDVFSSLEVETRIKILTEQGKERYSDVAIEHSRFWRLSDFAGRTVLPDGREIEISNDAIFVDTLSRARREFVTKAAFPAVEVGAILDYRYRMHWDSIFSAEPWTFANEVPTLLSEITYVVPKSLGVKPWGQEVGGAKLQVASDRQADGTHIKVWAENVRAIPDEPASFPLVDLSSRFMAVPTQVAGGISGSMPLMESWDTVADLVYPQYDEFRNRKRGARKKGKEIAAAHADAGRRAQAEAIYDFVRDQIRSDSTSVFVTETTADRVLAEGRGEYAEKALLLIEMLDGAGIDSELVWAASRFDGRIDTNVPNPWWFDRSLVRIDLDGEQVLVDPNDQGVGFGQLVPGFEGMPALIYSQRKPKIVTLPMSSPDDHLHRAELELAVDGEGRVTGSGKVRITGHHAWVERILSGDEEPAERWEKKLEESFTGYEASVVEVTDDRAGQAIEVTFEIAMRDEEVLGDEVLLWPSRPIGPLQQQFTLPPEKRLTPVQLPFADVEEVEMNLTYPPGWDPVNLPKPLSVSSPAGSAEQQVETDTEGRRVHYVRRLEVARSEFGSGDEYAALRQLLQEMERGDAQALALAVSP